MSRIRALLLAVVTVLAASVSTVALAQGPPPVVCKPRSEVLRLLTENYQEFAIGRGFQPNGTVLEVFASRAGTWTAVVSLPTGESCIVSFGEAWTNLVASADEPMT